jgi:capsular polysaccharide biosynthesis protein
MPDQNQDFEQEINLSEYLAVLIKRKKLILAVFLVSVIAVAAISYMKPKVWNVLMIIEPSSPGTGLLDTPSNLKARLDSGAFDLNVINALGLDPNNADVKLDVTRPKDSTFLTLSINESDSDKELGVRILNQFLVQLTIFYKEIIDRKKDDMDKQISVIVNGVKSKRDSIRLIEGNLKIIETREKELINELKDTKTNTEQLVAKRNMLLENKSQVDEISSLLYLNTIQQNMGYFNQLNNQLADIKTKKENMMNSTEALQTDINNLGITIEQLKTTQNSIRNIAMIQEPRISPKPVDTHKIKIVLFAGMLSLMAGALLAFFLESLGKLRRL